MYYIIRSLVNLYQINLMRCEIVQYLTSLLSFPPPSLSVCLSLSLCPSLYISLPLFPFPLCFLTEPSFVPYSRQLSAYSFHW